MSELIDRDVLAALLEDGCDWTVEYCGGGSISGSGPAIPGDILSRVPTRAKLRKLAAHGSVRTSRTYCVARVDIDAAGRQRVHIVEGSLR